MARTKPPPTPPHRIDPCNLYSVEQATVALGLPPTSLMREVRLGRLRASRRLGRHFFLGEWLLQWIKNGEVKEEQLNPHLATGEAG